MRSSSGRPAVAFELTFTFAFTLALACASRAEAQQAAQGFAVERLYTAAPGAGWWIMDDLAIRGGPGGAIALSGGYARRPLRVSPVSVISAQAFVELGLAVTYERLRVHLELDKPMLVRGESGVARGYAFTAPSIDAGNAPDLLSDVRVGVDTRVLGEATSAVRVGVGAQLLVPSGERAAYVTDDTYRAMARVLFAGDAGPFAYAGHVGAHVRPLDDAPAPGSPHGGELLFGVAAGPRFALGTAWRLVAGPEIFGETALRSLFASRRTGVEGLLTGRLEGARERGSQLRLKLGAGAGLHADFGAPQWRAVLGIELFAPDARAVERARR